MILCVCTDDIINILNIRNTHFITTKMYLIANDKLTIQNVFLCDIVVISKLYQFSFLVAPCATCFYLCPRFMIGYKDLLSYLF